MFKFAVKAWIFWGVTDWKLNFWWVWLRLLLVLVFVLRQIKFGRHKLPYSTQLWLGWGAFLPNFSQPNAQYFINYFMKNIVLERGMCETMEPDIEDRSWAWISWGWFYKNLVFVFGWNCGFGGKAWRFWVGVSSVCCGGFGKLHFCMKAAFGEIEMLPCSAWFGVGVMGVLHNLAQPNAQYLLT